MTKGTKIFRVIICVLLALTIIWGVICGAALILGSKILGLTAGYDIFVGGVWVIPATADDVLGDGTVYYDAANNILTLDNATIESDQAGIYARTDLNIELIGENKIICKNEEYSVGVYAGDNHLAKDLSFTGEGSLTIELPTKCEEAIGLFVSDLTVANDITINTSNCEYMVRGLVCDSSLLVVNEGTITINNGSAKNSIGARIRGNALFEEGTALNISINPGTTEVCKGFSVSGDVLLAKDASLAVSVDDEATALGECIRVSGLMEIGIGSTVTASSKNAHAIECFGTIEANKGAVISAASDKKAADVFCSGVVVNCGAEFDAKLDAIGGIHNRFEN